MYHSRCAYNYRQRQVTTKHALSKDVIYPRSRDVNFRQFLFLDMRISILRLVEYLKLNAAFGDGPTVTLTSSPLTHWELITVESRLLALLT